MQRNQTGVILIVLGLVGLLVALTVPPLALLRSHAPAAENSTTPPTATFAPTTPPTLAALQPGQSPQPATPVVPGQVVPPISPTSPPTPTAVITPTIPLTPTTVITPTAPPAPTATRSPPTIPPASPTPPPPPPALATSLDTLFQQSGGLFGVQVYDPGTQTVDYSRNASVVFPAASLIKIPIAVTVYTLAHQGSISLDTVLTMQAADIVGGTGSIQYDPPGSTYTLRNLSARMLYDSDNTATNMIIDHIGGFAPVNQTMAQLGATQTWLQRKMMDMAARDAGRDNVTTPADMLLLLHLLDSGTLPGGAATGEILQAMRQTVDRQKIPALLPPGVAMAHKIGTLPLVEHDVGLLTLPDGQRVVLVFLSQQLPSNQAGISTIAEAARLVYDAKHS